MNRVVWKYELPPSTYVRHMMPAGAKILSVHEQNGKMWLWALVEPARDKEARLFVIVGTGSEWDSSGEDADDGFIGTVHLNGGDLVFHVFESMR